MDGGRHVLEAAADVETRGGEGVRDRLGREEVADGGEGLALDAAMDARKVVIPDAV